MSAQGDSDEKDGKHDPDANRLMAKLIDRVNGVLFAHGFAFRDDDEDLQNFADEFAAMIYKYYSDLDGGDSSYKPGDSGVSDDEDDEEIDETGESESATLDSDSDEPPRQRKKLEK